MKITFTRIGYVLLTLVTVMVLFLSIARLATPWLSNYKKQIEQYASNQLGMSVEIQEIQAGWYYFDPVIHLTNVKVSSQEKDIVSVEDIAVGIQLFSSLFHWRVQPGVLIFSHASIHMNPTLLSNQPMELKPILNWILKRKKLILRDVNIDWTNTPINKSLNSDNLLIQQSPFKIANINMKLKTGFFSRHLNVDMDWLTDSDAPTHFVAYMDFTGDKPEINSLKGDFNISLENLYFSDWKKRIIPYLSEAAQKKLSAITVKQGQTHFQWNGEFEDGVVNNLWAFNLKNLYVSLPDMFNVPLFFSGIETQLNWNTADQKMSIQEFFIENPQISAKTTGNLTWSDEPSSLRLDSETHFVLEDVVAIKKYLPYKVMKPKLSSWLSQSIVGGKSTTGKMIFKGKLSDYPFDNMTTDQDIFLVDSDWENFSLDYKPGWPVAKSMHAHIIFKNRDLIAHIDSGTIDKLPLSNIDAQILALGLGKETLAIQGHLKTDAANAQHFILNSALKTQFKSFNQMSISGPANFDIDIQIPLYPENNTNLIEGKVAFLGNEFVLPEWWNLHFTHFKGSLSYNQAGIVDSKIDTSLLNYPLTLRMKTVTKPQIATQVDIIGKIGVDSLKKLFDTPLLDFMQGATNYTAQLLLTPSETDQDTLALNTNLNGLAIDLPKPYAKKANEKQPLSLLLRFSDVMNTILSIHYKDKISIHLDFDRINKAYQLHRGKIHLGSKDKELPTEDGLKIDGSIPEFVLSDWMPLFIKMNQPHKTISSKGNIVLQVLDLQIALINVMGEIIHNANVQLSEKNQVLDINIKSDEITGNLLIPETLASGITAKLDRLKVTSQDKDAREKIEKKSNVQPGEIPPLNLSVKNLQYNDMNLGEVKLLTEQDKTNNVMTIKQLNILSPNTRIDIKGAWSSQNNQSKSQITGAVSSNNMKQTLLNLGVEPVMTAKKGMLTFSLNWPDSFGGYTMALLSGLMKLKIENGVITHLDKSTQEKVGIGQLLGLLSPENLFKHLTFDFSDLSAKGLPFDKLQGDFSINTGKMNTKNTELDSSVAYIKMKGTIDLGIKTYNLLFSISPRNATSSLPVVATIAGGPVVGLATWAASTLINQGIKHSNMYRYKVTGPWAKPKITSLDKK